MVRLALFDLDNTLLTGDSDYEWGQFLVDRGVLAKMWVLRRVLMPMGTNDGLEFLINKLKESKSNSEFFDAMNT